ncbi:MAG: HesB/IscA family protein [Gammaproteobacteria bacterium]
MIEVTDQAVEQIKKAAEQAKLNPKDFGIRVAVNRKNNGDFDYVMGFDEESEDDLVYRKKGVKTLAHPAYAEMLRGCVLDFVELEPGQFEFVFMNPNDPSYVPPKV